MKTENMTPYERRALPSLCGFILHAESGLGRHVHDYKTLAAQRGKLASLIRMARALRAKVVRVESGERPWLRIYQLGRMRVTTFARES